MGAYILQRTLQMVVVVFGVVTVTFFAVRLVPGDPARLMEQPGTPESVLKLTRERLGTDKPLSVQYVRFLGDLVQGNLGTAFRGGKPVRSEVLAALPNTLALGAVTMVLTTTLSFLIGIAAAVRPGGIFDRISLVFVAIAQSTPSFWLGVILVLAFSIRLRWLPAIDMTGPKSFVLPVVTLTLTLMPLLIRAVRQSFLETLGEGFIRAGRARGLSERRLLFVHAMKVAAIPLITLVGLQAGYVLGGAVVIESIFNWPGIGNLALQAIQQRDFPMVQGTVLAIAIVFTLVNFLVDLAYSALDPRVKY
ncbi:MAG TPA: ABC transporter permease [Thermomicrobiales bacterium]|jgi:peptide/nickel transport system permease protein